MTRPSSDPPGFPSRFRAARLAAGYATQAAAAEKLGVTKGYLSQVESGHRAVTLEQRWELATKLGINPAALDDRFASVRRKAKP